MAKTMNKEFITYEQSLALKELGYDEDCLASYYHANKRLGIGEYINYGNYTILAPLKQQVLRWFREKYDAHMHPSRLMRNIYVVRYGDWDSEAFNTYEEAENACIDKLLEIATKN
jgi:hypothetical protein